MANELIGTGDVLLANNSRVRFEISSSGISFFEFNKESTATDLRDLVGDNASGEVGSNGYIVLTALPASPADAFYRVTVQLENDTVTLSVAHDEEFGASDNVSFKQLSLQFTHELGSSTMSCSGAVGMDMLGQTLNLEAQLGEDQRLQFVTGTEEGPDTIAIGDIGTASQCVVGGQYNQREGLKVLYAFSEGDGETIHDSAGQASQTDLSIHTPNDVSWRRGGQGGIIIDTDAEIHSKGRPNPLLEACKRSREITVEAWIKPETLRQRGPASIVDISQAEDKRLFCLGQGSKSGVSRNGMFNVRLRTNTTTEDGTRNGRAFESRANAMLPDLQYVVYTRNAEGQHTLYVNGNEMMSSPWQGTFGNWPPDELFILSLGSDRQGNNKWEGEVHRVAMYDRAMTADEVHQRYFPDITVNGTFTIANAPAPLDEDFEASLNLFDEPATVALHYGSADDEAPLEVRPYLHFNEINFIWREAAGNRWTLTGIAKTQFWETEVPLRASLSTASTPRISLTSPPNNENVQIALKGLATLDFHTINLRVLSGPRWALSARTTMDSCLLPELAGRDFDVHHDFMLLNPGLAIDPNFLLLTGNWLGERTAFHGAESTFTAGNEVLNIFRLEANHVCHTPMTLHLPPMFDSVTGVEIAAAVDIEQELMSTTQELALSENGFMSSISSSVTWTDENGVQQTIEVPEFDHYIPPVTQNELVRCVAEEIRTNARMIFVDQAKHRSDYQQVNGAEAPVLRFESNVIIPPDSTDPETIQTELPSVFKDAVSIGDATLNLISLTQADANAAAMLTIRKSDDTIDLNALTQAQIKTAFDEFWTAVAGAGVSLHPGAAYVLNARLAERLPVAFDSLLYYHYALSTGGDGNFINLVPGMRLRVDYQNYQFVHPSDGTAKKGFTGGSSVYYDVNSYGRRDKDGNLHKKLGFDAFLSILDCEVDTKISIEGAGGVLDTQQDEASRMEYWRLFYPTKYATNGSGSAPERMVTIVGANSMTGLPPSNEIFDDNDEVQQGIFQENFYFRGRASVVPEVAVFVRGEAVYVPVGTTLRQLIERYTGIPPAGLKNQDLKAFLGSTRPMRVIHEGVNSEPVYTFLNLETTDADLVNGLDAFDLPVLKGDRFFF